MAFGIDDAVAAVASVGGKLIDRLWPDPAQAAAAKIELLKMQQTGELAQLTAETDLLKGQLEVNKVEAASTSLFVGGWRPFIGWVCGASLAAVYIPKAVIMEGMWVYACIQAGALVTFPDLGLTDLFGLLGAMLGIGGMRTVEKAMGVATTVVTKVAKK
jgi:hypothetical protein